MNKKRINKFNEMSPKTKQKIFFSLSIRIEVFFLSSQKKKKKLILSFLSLVFEIQSL